MFHHKFMYHNWQLIATMCKIFEVVIDINESAPMTKGVVAILLDQHF